MAQFVSEHPASQVPFIESWYPELHPEHELELEHVLQLGIPEQSITHLFVWLLYL